MQLIQRFRFIALAVPALIASLAVVSAHAETIIDTWKTVAVPPPPEVQPVTVDAATTALLMLDFSISTCTQERRPTCARSIAPMGKLLAEARAHKMLVVYSTSGAGSPKTPDVLAPQEGDPSVQSGVDKFIRTDLEKILISHGIKTVIAAGTSAHGALIHTAATASQLGFQTIVPVDGLSAESPFAELYTVWHLKNAPGSVSNRMTISRTDLITIK